LAASSKTAKPPTPDRRFLSMPSSVIRHFAHDPASRQLTVTFTTGRVYVYDNVPDAVAAALRDAPSKGRFFNSQIRDAYRYRELPARGDHV
jgi:lysyl-tRNA synthetase class 2